MKSLITPRLMPISVLTAALQEIIPPERFLEDPIAASMEATEAWIALAKRLKIDLQLSAALAKPDMYLPLEAMLDPVAPHLAVRTPVTGEGTDLSEANAANIIEMCDGVVRIHDLAFCENLLHDDPAIRRQLHQHLLRVARAAVALREVGCTGVTGFIGRNIKLDMDQNVEMFEAEIIPLLEEFKRLGVTFYIENCPMPGWNTTDIIVNNIGCNPGMWIKLYRIAEKHGVEDVLRLNYDASHDVLYGTRPEASFAAMKAAGLEFMIERFHGKDQHRSAALTATWTVLGQPIDLGCRKDGVPDPDPRKQGGAWGVMTCHHGMPGIATRNPWGELAGTRVDWLAHQHEARATLGLDPETTVFHLEHEWGAARVQDLRTIEEMLEISINYIRGIDAAADAMYRAALWTEERNLPLPGGENPFGQILGLQSVVSAIRA